MHCVLNMSTPLVQHQLGVERLCSLCQGIKCVLDAANGRIATFTAAHGRVSCEEAIAPATRVKLHEIEVIARP